MNDLSAGTVAKLTVFLALTAVCAAQSTRSAGTLTIAGNPDQVPLVRINGKSYVDVESLARITHGSIRFEGRQTILTLPGASGGAVAATPAVKTPELSGGYLSAEILALTAIREWHAALVNAIKNNSPVANDWIDPLRRMASSKVNLALAAATTEPDHKAIALLQNELANMQQESDGFLAMHVAATYIPPDSFDNNTLDQKIISCEQALISMAGSKQFEEVSSCH